MEKNHDHHSESHDQHEGLSCGCGHCHHDHDHEHGEENEEQSRMIMIGRLITSGVLLLAGLLTILGMIIGIVNLFIGIAMLIVCVSQIPDSKQAVWIQKQEGYPYFNERFDEQMQYFGKEYQPDHAFDNLHTAEMLDMPEEGSPDFTVSPKDKMPEIPDIPDDIL